MRAGVTECDPRAADAGRARSRRSAAWWFSSAAPVEGRVFAVIGAKGGVGATTIAVNLAAAIARVRRRCAAGRPARGGRRHGGLPGRRAPVHASPRRSKTRIVWTKRSSAAWWSARVPASDLLASSSGALRPARSIRSALRALLDFADALLPRAWCSTCPRDQLRRCSTRSSRRRASSSS